MSDKFDLNKRLSSDDYLTVIMALKFTQKMIQDSSNGAGLLLPTFEEGFFYKLKEEIGEAKIHD
jgi:hypothetical protein